MYKRQVEGKPTEEGHYSIDEKTRQVELNEQGHQFIEDLLSQNGLLGEGESLYSAHNLSLLTHVYACLLYTSHRRGAQPDLFDGRRPADVRTAEAVRWHVDVCVR